MTCEYCAVYCEPVHGRLLCCRDEEECSLTGAAVSNSLSLCRAERRYQGKQSRIGAKSPCFLDVRVHSPLAFLSIQQIFDFGLARELLKSDAIGDGTYKLTNMCGTLRYMAPEVYTTSTPYNSKCDVYSFAILLWEILALKRPFERIRSEVTFADKVVRGGQRPRLCRSWPKTCRRLLLRSWDGDFESRFSMRELNEGLRFELFFLQGVEYSVDEMRRRSTFVFERKPRPVHAGRATGSAKSL